MMKIVLISILTPYKENYNGTSALPYHLMIHRDKSIKISIYSFNNNHLPADKIKQVEKELNVDIHLLPLPKWFKWMFKFHLLFLRLFLTYPVHNYIRLPKHFVDDIKSLEPDGVWVYGEEMSRVVKQFEGFKRIHTLPDCESLYYYRMLSRRFVIADKKKFWRCAFMYPKFLNMECAFENSHSVEYHLVGEEDVEHLKNINPGIKAHFIRHPHYEIAEPQKVISFCSPKIRLLIAGQYNYYMQQYADLLVDCLTTNPDGLKDKYVLTFLGKGWERNVEKLRNVGYDVKHISFANDYIEEIRKHDIQITPISIGTGTKGKVLDALANGLMVIGTKFALENIAVESGVSCIEYNAPEDVVSVLNEISNNISRYEQIAVAGRDAILNEHSRKNVAKQLFSLYN